MGKKHVRIMCRLITWNVDMWNHGLVEVRYTHVRDNIEHYTSMKQVYHMSNIIFIVYLWQGVAVGLNVECSKLMSCLVVMLNRFTK